ncbi:MAG: hypothetical protein JOZ16_16895 [Methylobacteriaceae bacterium]|nr:hypothetical protein [Methylobacteriaceae bacterium]
MGDNPFVGRWTYRSLTNDPKLETAFNALEFGRATIEFVDAPMEILAGTIGGTGWSLKLQGSREYGTPMRARFQGTGTINNETWIYNYEGWLVPHWPDGVAQQPAIVGSVIRTKQHAGSQPGSISPAGVVASFYAVREAS